MSVNTDEFQYPLTAVLRFTFEDLEDDGSVRITPPPGSTVVSGLLVIETPFNSGTSDNATVGDASDEDRYLGTTDVSSAGATALVPTGFIYEVVEDIQVFLTSAGDAATAGEGYLVLSCVDTYGKANESST